MNPNTIEDEDHDFIASLCCNVYGVEAVKIEREKPRLTERVDAITPPDEEDHFDNYEPNN